MATKKEVTKEEISAAQAEYRKTIEQYEKTNPAKFPSKKAELEEKYSRVTGMEIKGGRNVFILSEKN